MKLTEKLLKIQGAEFRVDKDGKNPHFKSSYVTLDNLLSVLLPIATELKIAITHYVADKKLITQVINTEEENDSIVSEFPIYQEDPQKIGSAITYAKRYNLGAIFNIITEVDDDGNSVSGVNHKTYDKPNGETVTIDDDDKEWFNQSNWDKFKLVDHKFNEPTDAIKKARKFYKVSNQWGYKMEHYYRTGEDNPLDSFPKK